MAKDVVLSVMALDRVGIVAGLTGAIVDLGGNIDAMSQTVMRGYFTIIMTVHFDQDVTADAVIAEVKRRGRGGELEVSVKERRVLQPGPVVAQGQRFILTIVGPDRKGVMNRVTSHLASRNINIEDLYAWAEGAGFQLIAQLQVPQELDVERLQMDVGSLWPPGEMKVSLQHENVFLATNEVEFRHKPS
jgi:glycine cleavage system transcriptional repressor